MLLLLEYKSAYYCPAGSQLRGGFIPWQASRHLWPLQMSNIGTLSKVSAKHCMAKERKRLGTRHVWETLDLNWTAIKECLFTRGPTGRNRQELYHALFGRARQGSARWQQAVYRGPGATYTDATILGTNQSLLPVLATRMGPISP